MPLNCKILKIKTSPQRATDLVKKAYNVLNSGKPNSADNCEYCRWTIESSTVEIVKN